MIFKVIFAIFGKIIKNNNDFQLVRRYKPNISLIEEKIFLIYPQHLLLKHIHKLILKGNSSDDERIFAYVNVN